MNENNKSNINNKSIPNELKDFNWGAFLLTFIWGIKYKAWITFLAIPLIIIQLPLGLNWIMYIAFQFYCGIKGNEWAYKTQWWKKPTEFNKEQTKWAIAAVTVNILVPFVILSLFGTFINKSPQNATNYMQNAQCSIAYKKIKAGLSKVKITNNTPSTEIAQNFSKRYLNAKAEDNVVIFKGHNYLSGENSYQINFSKSEDEPCIIERGNCVAQTSYTLPNDIQGLAECTFYFDNNRRIKPDEFTQDAINKGFNIFKYL